MRALLLAGVAAFGFASAARATTYTAEYVFGDSLSDNGNLAEVYYHQNLPNPPSYGDSFTNGPVANALLAQSLGLTLRPSLWVTGFQDTFNLFGGASFQPGTNYAVAGATAAAQAVGGPPAINLPQQVGAFTAATGGVADPNALYVVDIGGNDVRNAARQGTGSAAIAAGVSAELQSVQALAQEGARNILVVNVPDVGVIPEFAQDNPALAATATALSVLYDSLLASGLSSLALPASTVVTRFDLYSYNAALLANAQQYGFTNTTDRCYTRTPLSAATSAQCGPGAANIGSFIYWDAIHPTARVQSLWAAGFEEALGVSPPATAVPEPATLALLALPMVLVAAKRRRSASAFPGGLRQGFRDGCEQGADQAA